MAPKEKQKIEIEKSHRDPLLSFNQAVTVDCSDFLGTALFLKLKDRSAGPFKSFGTLTLGAPLSSISLTTAPRAPISHGKAR
jgi:hypothetical protein